MRIFIGLAVVLSLATGCVDDGTEVTPLPPNDNGDGEELDQLDDLKFDESLGNSEDTPDQEPNPCQGGRSLRRETDGSCGL